MPDQLQLRGGTTSEHSSFTGAAREVTVDTTKKTLVVHDGSQAGGTPLMKESGATAASSVTIGTGGVERLTLGSTEVVVNETGTDTDFRVEGNNNINLLICDAGNDRVGIGLNNPATTLSVDGVTKSNVNANDGVSTAIRTENGGTGTTIASYGFASGNSQKASIRAHVLGNGAMMFHNNNDTEKMRIDASGNVGIGTSSPTSLLHIRTASVALASNGHLQIQSTDAGADIGGQLNFGNDNARRCAIAGRQESSDAIAGYLQFGTRGTSGDITERMRIDSSGNVGIGMTPSGMRLDVQSTANDIARFSGPNAGGLTIRNDTSNEIQIHTAPNDALIFGTNGENERMRINSSGNVGIGTTSPTGKFAVSDGTTEGEINPSGGICYVGTRSNHPVTLLTNATGRMTIDTSGNVGINSDGSGPDRLLHVSDSNNGGAVTPFRLTNINGSSGTEVRMEFECGVDEIAYIGAKNEGSDIGPLIFATATSQAAYPTEKMRIGSNGAINAQGVYDQTTSSGANLNVASDGHIRRSTSSRRYKNTITDATHGLTELLKLKSVTFKGNEDGDTVFGGLIAEDVHNAGLTEFVHYDKDNEPDALAYGNMVALCVKAIQELTTKVAALEAA